MNKTLIVFLTLVFVSIFCAGTALAATYQMSYDDGSTEEGLHDIESCGVGCYGEEFDSPQIWKAVKFTTTVPIKINSIETYWADETGVDANLMQRYRVRVYNSANQLVYSRGWLTDPAHGWNSFAVNDVDLVFNSDFYVVINAPINASNDEMNLGTDTNGGNYTHSFYRSGGMQPITNENYMIRVTVEDTNMPPTLTMVLDAPDSILSGTDFTMTGYGVADADGDQLRLVCSYASGVDASTSECTSYADAIPPAEPECDVTADSDNAADTVYCKAFDGEDYSAERTAENTDDNVPPSVDLYTGDDASSDTAYDNDGTVYATMTNSDVSGINSCEIDWGEGAGYVPILPTNTSALSNVYTDGMYAVFYHCYDNVGLESTDASTIVVDLTPPTPGVLTVTGDSGNEEWDTDGNVHLSWTAATDTNGIVNYAVFREWTSPIHGSQVYVLLAVLNGTTLSYDDNGLVANTTYTYFVAAYDPVGHHAESNEDSTTVDTDKPSTQITVPVDGNITNDNDVEVSADYSNTYNVTCRARIDSGSWQDMSGDGAISGTATYDFGVVVDGSHTIYVECTDLALLSSMDSVTIFVDTVQPVVSIALGDDEATSTIYDNDGQVWAQLSNSDPAPASGIDSCEISWDDGSTWSAVDMATVNISTFYATDGRKDVDYRCTDAAGNVGSTTDDIFVDRIAPVTNATLGGDTCNGEWYTSEVDVDLTAYDPGEDAIPPTGSGVDVTEYQINGGGWMDYTGTITISTEGITTVEYRSVDNAGNVENTSTVEVKIDWTAPEAEIIFPVDTEHLANPVVLFDGIAYDDLGAMNSSGINRTELFIGKTRLLGIPSVWLNYPDSVVLDWTAADGTDAWTYNWTSTENIEYFVVVRAYDNACNAQDTILIDDSYFPFSLLNQPARNVHYFTVQDDYDYKYYTKPEIDAMVLDLQTQIDDLDARVNVTEQEIAEIQTNLSFVWMAIADLYEEDAALWAAIGNLTTRVDALELKVEHMNHGTIQLDDYFTTVPPELIVYGEAPEGAVNVQVQFWDIADNSLDYTTTVPVTTLGNNSNYYEARVNHSLLDENVMYEVYSVFYDGAGEQHGYAVSEMYLNLFLTHQEDWLNQINLTLINHTEQINNIWSNITAINNQLVIINGRIDDLNETLTARIDALNASLINLTDRVEFIELRFAKIGDFGTYHDQTEETLEITGSGAPEGAVWARITVITVDHAGDPFGWMFPRVDRFAVLVNADGTFEHTFDTSSWPEKGMNIYVQFYESRSWSWMGWQYHGLLHSIYNTWYGMTLPELGFRESIASRTYEVFDPQSEFSRVFDFRFSAPYTGWYRFSLVQESSTNGEDVSKTFPGGMGGCHWLTDGQTVAFLDTVELPPVDGQYRVHLLAQRCMIGTQYESNPFIIEVDDLASPWPTYGVGTVSVSPDSDHYFDGIYWTNQPVVEMEAMLGGDTEWMNDLRCEVWNYVTKTESRLYERWNFQEFVLLAPPPVPTKHCNGDIDLAAIPPTRNSSAPQYDIEICAHPIVGQVECGDTTFGYDTHAPVINFIYPAAYDNISGVYTFAVNVTDDGAIRYVFMTLINKTNESDTHPVGGSAWEMVYNPVSGLYEFVLNTSQVPDGYYNISIHAIDWAGNEAYGVLDPIIDNTAPMVQSVDASGYYGGSFTVNAAITDNLAGVASAQGELIPYTCGPAIEPSVVCVAEGGCEVPVVCEATYECPVEQRIYDCVTPPIEEMGATGCEYVVIPVDLALTSGDALSGTWTGSVAGLANGRHYEVRVHATDSAGNDNTAENADLTMDDLYSMASYTVTVSTVTSSPQYAGNVFTVQGGVVASDGSAPGSNVVLSPWSVSLPLLLGNYQTSQSLDVGTGQVITATYIPFAECPGISFIGTTTVDIVAAPRSSGGGGGGGGGIPYTAGATTCADGYKRVNDECVLIEQPAPEVVETGGQGEVLETSGGAGEQIAAAAPVEEPAPVETPAPENLATGAVTGGGTGGLIWLWVLLGLIVLGTAGYFIFKGK